MGLAGEIFAEMPSERCRHPSSTWHFPICPHAAQYPHELEILFPPLTSIEVRSLRVEKKARPGLEHGRPALHTSFRMPSTCRRCW